MGKNKNIEHDRFTNKKETSAKKKLNEKRVLELEEFDFIEDDLELLDDKILKKLKVK